MKSRPRSERRRATAADVRARIAAWCEAHPGYNESNWVDAFRDKDGRLIESDEFDAAAFMFALPH